MTRFVLRLPDGRVMIVGYDEEMGYYSSLYSAGACEVHQGPDATPVIVLRDAGDNEPAFGVGIEEDAPLRSVPELVDALGSDAVYLVDDIVSRLESAAA